MWEGGANPRPSGDMLGAFGINTSLESGSVYSLASCVGVCEERVVGYLHAHEWSNKPDSPVTKASDSFSLEGGTAQHMLLQLVVRHH